MASVLFGFDSNIPNVLLWSLFAFAWIGVHVSHDLDAPQSAAGHLLEASVSPESWERSPVGSIAHIAGRKTLE